MAKDYRFVLGAVDSQNIAVKINRSIGYTVISGLKFRREVVLNIWEDGSIEVDVEGVVAIENDDIEWISKKVKYEGKEATLVVRR